jgi:hypothetical protein
MNAAGNVLAGLGLAALVGGMLFFAAILTPLVFTQLPPDVSGPFIRTVFPRYYAYIVICASVAALGYLVRGQVVTAVVLAVIVAVTLWLWLWLIPQLNAWRDAGNMLNFGRGHQLSVIVNGAEFVAACWMLVRASI